MGREVTEEVIHQRNEVCSRNLLESLIAHHGDEPENIPESSPPAVLPPIPDSAIAAAHDDPRILGGVRCIQEVVCREFGISRAEMLSQRRTKNLIVPRHIALYLSKKLTPLSLPSIGKRFGGRDHTTALSAIRRIEHLMAKDSDLASRINMLEERLGECLA